jgi:hypothetical protein
MSRTSLRTESKKILKNLSQWLNIFHSNDSKTLGEQAEKLKDPPQRSLTLPAGPALPTYQLLDDSALANEVFVEVKQHLFALIEEVNLMFTENGENHIFFKESGMLSGKRPYFYLKLSGEKGLLFERSGSGWLVAPADKIVGRDFFVRNGELLDAVQVYTNLQTGRVRLSSTLLDLEQVGLTVYCERLVHLLQQQVGA